MTQPTTDNRPLVGSYGDVYTAPAGTPAPADLDAPATPWVKLGLISEDGATWTPPTEETTDIGAWQSPYPVRIVTTSLTTSIQFALMEWDRDTLPFALGGGDFTDDAVGGNTTFHPPAAGAAQERALFLKVLDDPITVGLYYPKGRVTERGETTFTKDEAALLDVTFGIVGDVLLEPYNLIFPTEDFPAATVLGALEGGSERSPQTPSAQSEPIAA